MVVPPWATASREVTCVEKNTLVVIATPLLPTAPGIEKYMKIELEIKTDTDFVNFEGILHTAFERK